MALSSWSSVQFKVLLIILLFVAGFGAAQWYVFTHAMVASILEVEEKGAEKSLEQTLLALEKDLGFLNAMSQDWSSWDDTYRFVRDRNEEYVNSNLQDVTLKNLGVDILVIHDAQGAPVIQIGLDRETMTRREIPPAVNRFLAGHVNHVAEATPARVRDEPHLWRGLLIDQPHPMLLAVRPILRSDESGPAVGALAMGLFLDDHYLNDLSQRLRLRVTLLPVVATPPLLGPERHLASSVGNQAIPMELVKTPDRIEARFFYPGLTSRQRLPVSVHIDRTFVNQTLDNVHKVFLMQLAGFLAVMLTLFLLLREVVLNPLRMMTRYLNRITDYDDLSRRCTIDRRDEIGVLAHTLNDMMHRIGDQSRQLLDLNDRLVEEVVRRKFAEDELKSSNRELEALSRIDPLTQIPNRRHLEESLVKLWNHCIRQREPLAIILADVDHFKAYNDRYGHPQGDICLQQVAGVMQRALGRKSDVLARYGGEEFMVILPGTTLEGAEQVGERLLRGVRGLEMPHQGSPHGVVTISLGVTGWAPVPGESPETMVNAADQALYNAKSRGRNIMASTLQAMVVEAGR